MIDITYFEAMVLLAATPGIVFVAYWKGYTKGKREGWHAGRSLLRIPVRNDR
jgi:hypothetical protein